MYNYKNIYYIDKIPNVYYDFQNCLYNFTNRCYLFITIGKTTVETRKKFEFIMAVLPVVFIFGITQAKLK